LQHNLILQEENLIIDWMPNFTNNRQVISSIIGLPAVSSHNVKGVAIGFEKKIKTRDEKLQNEIKS
jgi:hypothetical protein